MSDHESEPTTVYRTPTGVLRDEEPADELPVRPRRRLLTPVSGGLLAIVLVAGGFIGGVLVQKGQNSGGGGGLGRMPRAPSQRQRPAARPAAPDGAGARRAASAALPAARPRRSAR